MGTHSITANYGGDTNYTAAVSTAVSQVVNKASSTVTLASSPNPSTFGAVVTLTATVTAGATGTVTFEDGATSIGTGTISSGVATLTVSTLSVGTHSDHGAVRRGHQLQQPAVSTAMSQVVNKAAATVTLASLPNAHRPSRAVGGLRRHGHRRGDRDRHLRRRRNVYRHRNHQ